MILNQIHNRRACAKPRPQDLNATPARLAKTALDLVPRRLTPRHILDPGAGLGVWGEAARSRWPDSEIDAVEIRAEVARSQAYTNWWTGDFLTTLLPGGYDLIVGSPPYSQAEPFVRRAITLLKPDGHLVFLLRLAFLEGAKRAHGLFRLYPPYKVYVLAERPCFPDRVGRADPSPYALFYWSHPGWPHDTQLEWLSWR